MPDSLTHTAPVTETVADTQAHVAAAPKAAPKSVAPARKEVAPVDTSLVADSLAVDSLAVDSIDSLKAVTPVVVVEKPRPPRPPMWTTGLEPVPRVANGIADPGMLTAIVVVMVAVLLCIRNSGKLMSTLFKDLFSVRTRDKSFDEHTANESRVVAIFGLQLVLYLGVLLMATVNIAQGNRPMAGGFLKLMPFVGMCAAYYLFQLVAYWSVGYAFTSNVGRRQWLRGFNASQAFLGFAVALPALLVVFYPHAAFYAVTVAAALYLIARLIFISKGLRIFYDNFSSIIYFILYLCTLEIIPLLFLFRTALGNSSPFVG